MIDTLVNFVAGHTVKETVEGQAVAVFRIPASMHVFGPLFRSAALLDGKKHVTATTNGIRFVTGRPKSCQSGAHEEHPLSVDLCFSLTEKQQLIVHSARPFPERGRVPSVFVFILGRLGARSLQATSVPSCTSSAGQLAECQRSM